MKKYLFNSFIVFLILIILVLSYFLFTVLRNYKKSEKNEVIDPKFNKQVLNHKSSCYSCEAQLSDEEAWSSNPTKCFSCQRELVGRSGNPNLGYVGSTIKYY